MYGLVVKEKASRVSEALVFEGFFPPNEQSP